MQKAMAKEGIMPGKGGCQVMGGGMMSGMQQGMTGNGTTGQVPAAGHGTHGAPVQQ